MASSDEIAWATALWFWNANVINGPYGARVINGQFGASTNAIRGSRVCGRDQSNARQRFEVYKNVVIALNLNIIPDARGCYN